MSSQRSLAPAPWMRGLRAALPVVLALIAATACTSTIEPRLQSLESRQAALEGQIAELVQAQQEIGARLAQVRQELDNSLQPLRTQSADRGEDMRALRREVTALEQRYAEVDERIGRLTEQLASGQVAGGGSRQLGTPMPPPRGARPQQDTTATPQVDSEATTLYNNAFNDYLRESYDLCVQGFEEYIRRYPVSDRADDAQYWVGECYGSRGDVAAARTAFQKLIRDYPDSDKIPDAMLRDGLLLKDAGQEEAAAEALRRLVQAYPASDAAFLACRQLTSMGAATPEACRDLQ